MIGGYKKIFSHGPTFYFEAWTKWKYSLLWCGWWLFWQSKRWLLKQCMKHTTKWATTIANPHILAMILPWRVFVWKKVAKWVKHNRIPHFDLYLHQVLFGVFFQTMALHPSTLLLELLLVWPSWSVAVVAVPSSALCVFSFAYASLFHPWQPSLHHVLHRYHTFWWCWGVDFLLVLQLQRIMHQM